MSKTLLTLAAAMLMIGGLASVPASAQTAAPAAKAPAHKMAHHAARHKMTCYDYAWESQAQKDCLAGKSAAPAHKAAVKKSKKMKKKTT